MSGNAPENPSTPVPPEVPDEFADAYRAAYERALAAQSDVAQHRSATSYDGSDAQDPERLPRRVAPLRVGTHRTPAAEGPVSGAPSGPARAEPVERRHEDRSERERRSVLPQAAPPREDDEVEEPTAYERVRDSRWFVPVLLLLLAVLLVLGAYAVGRAFSGSVGDAGGSPEARLVTAPAAP